MEGLAQRGAESGQPPTGQAHGTASRWERRAKAGQALAWEGARRIPVLGPKPLASSMWPSQDPRGPIPPQSTLRLRELNHAARARAAAPVSGQDIAERPRWQGCPFIHPAGEGWYLRGRAGRVSRVSAAKRSKPWTGALSRSHQSLPSMCRPSAQCRTVWQLGM